MQLHTELTIGEYFEHDGRRAAATHDFIVYPDRDLRWTYAEFDERVDQLAKGLLAIGMEPGDHLGIWARNVPDWLTFAFATAKIGVVLVTVNPVYKSHELAYVIKQSDMKALVHHRRVPRRRLRRDRARAGARVDDAGARPPRLARSSPSSRPSSTWVPRSTAASTTCPSCSFSASTATTTALRATPRPAHARRHHQHAVHLGHDRLSQGRHAHAPQHPQQRLLHRRAPEVHARRTASACRCRSSTASASCWACSRCSRTARRSSMVESFDPRARARGRPEGDARPRSTACRRCSSPSSTHPMFDMFDLTSLRTGIMAGSPCPIETMRQVIDKMHASRDDDLLRPDRGLAGVHADDRPTTRSSASARRSAASTTRSRCASSIPRPARTARRTCRASCCAAATTS